MPNRPRTSTRRTPTRPSPSRPTTSATRPPRQRSSRSTTTTPPSSRPTRTWSDTTVIDDPDHAPLDAPDTRAGDDAPTTVIDGAASANAADAEEPTVAWAPTEPRHKKRHLALWIGIPVGVALVGVAVTSTILIAPGVAIAGVPVGGMTPGAAAEAVQTALQGTTVVLTAPDGATIELTGAELGAAVDAKALANSAYGDHPLWNVSAWNPEPIAAPVVLETDEATAALREAAPALYVEPIDATLAFDAAAGGYVVVPAVAGTGVDVVAVEAAVSEALAAGDGTITIDAPAQEIEATITTPEAEAGAAQVNAMLAGSGFYIGEERTIPVDAATTASWLTVTLDEAGAPVIVADPAAIQPLIDTIPAAVNRAPVNAATVVNNAGRCCAPRRRACPAVSSRPPTASRTSSPRSSHRATPPSRSPSARPPSRPSASCACSRSTSSDQRLYLKENGNVVDSWAISSGKSTTPTFTGRYTINSHVRTQTMRGPGEGRPGQHPEGCRRKHRLLRDGERALDHLLQR